MAMRSHGDTSLRPAAAPATTIPTSPGMTKSMSTALSPNDTPSTARHKPTPPRRATASRIREPTRSAGPQALAEQLGVVGHEPAQLVLDHLPGGVAGQGLDEHDVPRAGEAPEVGRHEVRQLLGARLGAAAGRHHGAHRL